MMVEVPSGELAGGNSARNRIEQRQNPFHDRAAPLENRVVNDLVQQDGEVENRESLHQRQRHPDEWVVETDEAPRSEREDCKLSRCHRGVPPGIFLVQFAHLFARKRPPKLSSERNRVLRVVMRFHGNKQLYPGSVVRDPGSDPNSTADRIRRPGWGMRRPSSRFGSVPEHGSRFYSGFGLIGVTRVSATPSTTAAVPSILRMPSGSPSRNAAPAIATSGTRLEYTDVRAEPICRTAAYQIV